MKVTSGQGFVNTKIVFYFQNFQLAIESSFQKISKTPDHNMSRGWAGPKHMTSRKSGFTGTLSYGVR